MTKPFLPTAADRFLAKPEVLRIAGFSAATLWREVQAGRFPAPIPISANRVGFLESEVQAWVNKSVLAARQVRSVPARDCGS
jgi:prophage regulatory protein